MKTVSDFFDLLPMHECSFDINHNPHRKFYESIDEFLHNTEYQFQYDNQKQRCIDNDEIWSMTWFPRTPVASVSIAAPTLEELMAYAKVRRNG